jgi:hypothetical protein
MHSNASWFPGMPLPEHDHVDAIAAPFVHPLPAPLDPTLGHEVIFIASLPAFRIDTG